MAEIDLAYFSKSSLLFALGFVSIAALSILFSRKDKSVIPLIIAILCYAAFFLPRAYLKNFFPFTDKVESFVTLSWLLTSCALIYRKQLSRFESLAVLFLAILAGSGALTFNDVIKYPTAYLRTIWYPLHVPLSFMAYAFWFLAAVCAVSPTKQTLALEKEKLKTAMIRNGFIAFTMSMIFGGIWGYLAWGAYFIWDPKIIWAVILWLFYGNLLHVDHLPKFKHWKKPLLFLGFILILITFIGTGFFTRSIHKF